MKTTAFLFIIIFITYFASSLQQSKDPCYLMSVDNNCSYLKEKKVILGRDHPAKQILIGHSGNEEHELYLVKLLETLPPHLLKVIITNKESEQSTKEITRGYHKIKVTSHEGLHFTWIQDYFKLITLGSGEKQLLSIPYPDKSVLNMNNALINSCNLKQTKKYSISYFDENVVTPGDYAGNIYPINDDLVVVGETMREDVFLELSKSISQKIIKIDTSWFEIGHVDELVSIFPIRKNSEHCQLALAYASPRIALDIIEIDSKKREELLNYRYFLNETTEEYTDCLLHLAGSEKRSIEDNVCHTFKAYNLNLEQLQVRNVDKIIKNIDKQSQCKITHVFKLPVFFAPIDKTDDDELRGLARTINPNPVNNFLIDKKVYLLKQLYDPFEQYIETYLKSLSFFPVLLDGVILHDMSGGTHCNTQIIRGC